jgi:mannose-6-phosphate isomerase-like protein (cupin superfamily)
MPIGGFWSQGPEEVAVVLQKVNLDEQFSRFSDTWSPKIIGTVNDYDVKVAKVQDEFVWHAHDETDELFFVHRGRLVIRLEDLDAVVLEPSELFVVPRGVRHCPAASEGAEILLIERAGTLNTENAGVPGTAGDAVAGTY